MHKLFRAELPKLGHASCSNLTGQIDDLRSGFGEWLVKERCEAAPHRTAPHRMTRARGALLHVSRSDGPQPHLINIQFHKKMHIHEIVIYTDFKLDESYTPSKISIRAGSTFHDLQEIHVEELNEPSGWVTILPPRDETADGGVLRTHFIQVAVLANHQNGRDTHIRQIKIYTPRRLMGQHMGLPEFNSVSFQQYACLR